MRVCHTRAERVCTGLTQAILAAGTAKSTPQTSGLKTQGQWLQPGLKGHQLAELPLLQRKSVFFLRPSTDRMQPTT